MSWKIVANLRKTLAAEEGSVATKRGGSLRICLLYPNRYRAAMSNLGFQTLYARFNSRPEILCERAFLPDPADLAEYSRSRTPLLSLESQQPVGEFDVIAFSVSFESDYLHIPALLRLAGVPPLAGERGAGMPLVMAGGAALFLNPEPVADFLDLVCLGEAEPLLPPLVELLLRPPHDGREALLKELARLPGCYVPSLHRLAYEGERLVCREPLEGAPATVQRQWAPELDAVPTESVIRTEAAEFGDMHLLELSRGCPRGCRFCAAGFIYLPYRQRSLPVIREMVDRALARQHKIGLVAAAVGDYRGIGELCRHILAAGGKVSVSSLRIDGLDGEMVEMLRESGHKTATLAPEGGSQRLRDLVRKGISEDQILSACDRLIDGGILNLKLYFIIGLPTEGEEDLAELVALVVRIRERVVARARGKGRLGEVTLSVNPFIPKPFTPFQWCAMAPLGELEGKAKFLQRQLGRLSNVRLQVEGLKEAVLQALLSRGDRRLAPMLLRADEPGGWRRAAKSLGIDVEGMVTRTIPLDETLPWDFIDSGSRDRLVREYLAAFPEASGIPGGSVD